MIDPGFLRLLREEGIADPGLLESVKVFDEVPVYSRLEHLSFVNDLSLEEQNRFLIRATTDYLDWMTERIRDDGGNILRLISITDWWSDDEAPGRCTYGDLQLITPHFWIADMSDPHLQNFRLFRPTTRCGAFVRESITHHDYDVYESELEHERPRCPARVYIGKRSDLEFRFSGCIENQRKDGYGLPDGYRQRTR